MLKIMSIISYVLLGFWCYICIFFAPLDQGIFSVLFILIPMAMFITSGVVLGKLKNRFYVDYDYIFVSGSIRFSKVIKNINRKFIVKFECSDIEKIGKIGSGTFNKYNGMPDIKRMILTSNAEPDEGKDFFYIVANVEEEKKLFILECTETFMVNVLKFSRKTVLEEDYGK